MDYICQGSHQGFKVFSHLPTNLPAITDEHLFVPIKHDVIVSSNAKVTKISEGLRSYKPHQRNCFMVNERPLKFFKSYTRFSCRLECFANYTLKVCGCSKFSMPRENSSKICDYTQLACAVKAKRDMMLAHNTKNLKDLECNCLPSCTEIDYTMNSFQTDFDFKKLFDSYRYDISDMPG